MRDNYEIMEEARVSNNGLRGPWHILRVLGRRVGVEIVGFSFVAISGGGLLRYIEGGECATPEQAAARALGVIIGFGIMIVGIL